MSPGIVRFYFDSKAAMLVASLQFLSAEFEEQVLLPVSKLRHNPVAGLELLVDLYLDPEIASPRKVSVWYAFWGEASSRQEYYDICGNKDESFAAMVRELIGRLIEDTAQPQLDPGGIALGLIGVLEILWQDFAFQSEQNIDRRAAKRRCMAYLRSIFPGRFDRSSTGSFEAAHAASPDRLAGWSYANERAYRLERDTLFQGAWQAAVHESQIARAGDFAAADLGVERALLTRDSFGSVHALRDSCPAAPHALATSRSGRLEAGIECRLHRLRFGLNGRRAGGATRADLHPLPMQAVGGFVLVRSSAAESAAAGCAGWFHDMPAAHLVALGTTELDVASDWKVLVEQWLEAASPRSPPTPAHEFIEWTSRPLETSNWSAERYRRIVGERAAEAWEQRFLAPNHLLQLRPDGVSLLQAIPTAPGRCRLRGIHLTNRPAGREADAARYLASRLSRFESRPAIDTAESTQRGVFEFGYRAAADGRAAPAVAWFLRHLLSRLPLLALERPPTVS